MHKLTTHDALEDSTLSGTEEEKLGRVASTFEGRNRVGYRCCTAEIPESFPDAQKGASDWILTSARYARFLANWEF
jgi:hypothetical protein